MRHIRQEEIARRVNVTSRTIRNWERDKPELLRLLRLAIDSESYHLDFWNLLDNTKSITSFNDFYIDFYFKFLNFFRKNVTMSPLEGDGDVVITRVSTSIVKTLMVYLLFHYKRESFEGESTIALESLTNPVEFELDKFLTLNCNSDLSKYVLRNTVDDFETLVQDSYSIDQKFVEAIKISIYYIVYKYKVDSTFREKNEIYNELIQKIAIDKSSLKNKIKINKKVIFKNYIEVKDEFSICYLNILDNEPEYKKHCSAMFERMESKIKRYK